MCVRTVASMFGNWMTRWSGPCAREGMGWRANECESVRDRPLKTDGMARYSSIATAPPREIAHMKHFLFSSPEAALAYRDAGERHTKHGYPRRHP